MVDIPIDTTELILLIIVATSFFLFIVGIGLLFFINRNSNKRKKRKKIAISNSRKSNSSKQSTEASPLPDQNSRSGYKPCPYCAEMIQEVAIVCRFCGRDLTNGENAQPQVIIEPAVTASEKHPVINFWIVVGLLIGIGVCLSLFDIFFRSRSYSNNSVSLTIAARILSTISPSNNNPLAPTPASGGSSGNTYKNLVEVIDGWRCSPDGIGNMIFRGKVENISTAYNLRFVKLRATVFKSAGEVVNTNIGYIDSDILYANSSSTFTIYVDDPNREGSLCKIKVEDASLK